MHFLSVGACVHVCVHVRVWMSALVYNMARVFRGTVGVRVSWCMCVCVDQRMPAWACVNKFVCASACAYADCGISNFGPCNLVNRDRKVG